MISFFFFFKQKTAYEMRISDWSSDVCSSDLSSITMLVNNPRQKRRARDSGQSELRARRGQVLARGPSERLFDRRGRTALPCGREFRERPRQNLTSGSLAQPDRARRAPPWVPGLARLKNPRQPY